MKSELLEARHLALAQEARAAFESLEPKKAVPQTEAELASALAKLGYYPYLVPAQFNGRSERVDFRSLCVLREELAYRSPSADAIFAVQGLGSHPIVLAGTDAQRRELLPAVAAGAALLAFALTEPDAGSDVAAIASSARKEGDSYLLSGTKRFISNAGIATHYTVFARTGAGSKGLSAFVVPANAQGFQVSAKMELLSDHPVGELRLIDCRVPRSARLGEEGDGLRLALATLDAFRSTVGAAAVGMARRAQEEAIAYARSRRQFGAPLAALQGVQFLLADSAVEIEAARLLVHRAAAAKDAGAERVTFEASMAKLFATEAAQRVIDRSVQIHGGNGLIRGCPVERLYREIRALRIYEGASEIQRVLIARHLLEAR
jgi:acyl-CoA dehydrogenase